MLYILYQAHAGSWAFLFIFFLLSYFLPKQKITMMIQRLFVVIMLVSGIGMVIGYGFPLIYIFKGVLAVALIAVMEILIGRRKRQQSQGVFWIACILLSAAVLIMGFMY